LRKLRITIIDLIPQGPATSLWARVMNANMASIMPPVVATWCEQAGHEVRYFSYTGFEDLEGQLPTDDNLVFISSFTRSALLAYAVSNICRKRGAVTVLGGPHARCYPDDAVKYFDYVVGFTDRSIIENILQDCAPHRPLGRQLSASRQPTELPGLEERWKFVSATLAKAPLIKFVPMVGSLGCPYQCSFCIDAEVEYTPLDFDQLREDLRFLLTRVKRPRVGWHDPNFGIRFDDYMNAIEETVPPGRMDHIAESSLSLLSEPHLKRMQANGFKGLLPGIESWYEMGGKSRTGGRRGTDKVRQVADHINMLLRYVPYVQTNFVLGLDSDEGAEPFELTKQFVDLSPGAFPSYALLTAFGRAAPVNLELQRAGRVLPFPFHLLDNNSAMNVRPLNYEWKEFYDHLVDLTAYSFSRRAARRRLAAQGVGLPGLINLVRAISTEGRGRIRYHSEIRSRLDSDRELQRYWAGETNELPRFYRDRIQRKLGPFWEHLPQGALYHDAYAWSRLAPATGTTVSGPS